MKEIKYRCDKCTQEFSADEGAVLTIHKRPGESGRIKKSDVIKQMDLCEDCLRDLREFLDLNDNYIDNKLFYSE